MGNDEAQRNLAKMMIGRAKTVATVLPAAFVAVYGVAGAASWLGGSSDWLHAGIGIATVFSTACGLAIVALGVLAASRGTPAARTLQHVAGIVAVLIGAAASAQHLFGIDLGLDLRSLHGSHDPFNPTPGRMAPASAAAMVLSGLLLLLIDRPRGRLAAGLVQLLAVMLMGIALAAGLTHDVATLGVFGPQRFVNMAAYTSVAFIALSFSFLALIARSAWYEAVYAERADEKIMILSLAILLLMIDAAGSTAFAALQRHLEAGVRASFAQAVAERVAIVDTIISSRITRASIVATRPALRELLARWKSGDEALRERIRLDGRSYLPMGFQGLAYYDEHGEPIAHVGIIAPDPRLSVPIGGGRVDSALAWSDGYVLRTSTPVYHDVEWVGYVITEQPLDSLTRLQFDVGNLGKSAEWVMCAQREQRMACFPHSFDHEPRLLPRTFDGAALPMDRALHGASGVEMARDYRGEHVIAAFAPVSDTGLGLVLKIDVDEFYAPLREQMRESTKWFLAVAILGALLVASQVRPVAQRLVASERELRELYESVNDGIAVLRPDGTIEFLNPAAERLFGYGSGELAGKHVSMLVPEALRGANAEATRRYMETGVPSLAGKRGPVLPAMRRDGTRFDVELSLSEMRRASGRRVVAIVRDVSERLALERMKSEFIAGVSHELRTPLTSIVGAIEILRESETLEPGDRSFVEMAARNSERLNTLVNDVIDAERIESGGLQFVQERVDMGAFLRDAVQMNQTFASAKGAFFYLDEPLPAAAVTADRDRLMQVMANLLSNAAKFSPQGEEVRVRARLEGKRVRVEVVDHGAGVPEDFKPRIFEKFAQADASDTGRRSGTGLGLAICKGIIARLGGTIGFTSRVGEGSTFWFELPLARD